MPLHFLRQAPVSSTGRPAVGGLQRSNGLATAVPSDGLGCIPDMEISMNCANVLYSGNFALSCCYLTLQLLLLFGMMPWYSLVSHVSG